MDGLEVRMDGLEVYKHPKDDAINPDHAYQHDVAWTGRFPRLPWSLSVLAYTLLVAGLSFVICAAALGGGLGSALAHCERATATAATAVTTTATTLLGTTTIVAPTSSPTSSGLAKSYAPLPADAVETLVLNCVDQAIMTSQTGDQYQLNCNIDHWGNDLVNMVVYTLGACIQACSNMNGFNNQTKCRGVLFNANLQLCHDEDHGNCWLKSQMLNPLADNAPPSVGAVLLL